MTKEAILIVIKVITQAQTMKIILINLARAQVQKINLIKVLMMKKDQGLIIQINLSLVMTKKVKNLPKKVKKKQNTFIRLLHLKLQ